MTGYDECAIITVRGMKFCDRFKECHDMITGLTTVRTCPKPVKQKS